VLQVRDDGPGIPDEHAERIFDRFYRVEGPQASGSGLGLAIARELAEHMGGTVELSSVDGWTTFTMTLPAVAVAPEPVPVS
jgi:signal transduction histidine kinase